MTQELILASAVITAINLVLLGTLLVVVIWQLRRQRKDK